MSVLPSPVRRASLAALCLAAVPLVAVPSAGPATAATSVPATGTGEVTQNQVRIQDPVVLYASHIPASPLRVPIEVDLADNYGVLEATVYVGADDDDYTDTVSSSLTLRSGTRFAGTWTGSTTFDKYAKTGPCIAEVEALVDNPEIPSDSIDAITTFIVKRNTMMPAFNASPEPVRKGSPVKVAGRLTKLWPDVGYVGYSGKTISVYFKPVGGTWTLKGSATTDSNGYWSRSFTATEDGSWQARFKGTSNYHRETSHSDYVDVQ